jgi:polysaccharide export outer membrane protein
MLLAVLLTACGASLNDGGSHLSDSGEPKLSVSSIDGESPRPAAVSGEKSRVSAISADAATAEARKAAVKSADRFMAASTPGNTAYKIGPLDVLEVSVFQAAELSRITQVSDAGSVGLPLVGEIPAAGKTAQELERDLARVLKAKYMQNPQVTVFVKEFNSQRVTVEGAVRKTDKGRLGARFDLAAIRAGQAEDPAIQSGDVIVVGSSFWKEQFNNFTKLLPLASAFALLL